MASSVSSTGSSSSANSTWSNQHGDAYASLDTSQFIKLLVAELQNQDPLDPMKNSELLQQVSQIKAIDSNDKLSTMLGAVTVGQNLATASSLIKRKVEALDDSGNKVTGVVDKVTVTDGDVKVHIGDSTVRLSNISQILDPETST